jgi:hypothetical protein
MTIDAVVFDRNYLTIYHDSDHKLVYLKWKAFANSEQYREAMLFTLETIREHHIELMLGDLKQMESISPADETWTSQVYTPQLVSTHLRKVGLVSSLDYFNNMAIKRVANATVNIGNYETRFFVDASEAREWLLRDQ